jgi:16S rRNA (adenine1518-N6/adenine1519-N6)-dimethyltransferase
MSEPKKSLGQHWLKDPQVLQNICDVAELTEKDTVLEIGPGTGTLTEKLLESGASVIAIEKDDLLAAILQENLPHHESAVSKDGSWKQQIQVVKGDILEYDLNQLYKVVANIPYYLTSNLLRVLSESKNSPSKMVLLIQKEVAQRICSGPGDMSILAVSVQLFYEPKLDQVIDSSKFTPPPKVDSQVIILDKHQEPLFENLDYQKFFRIVKAGFSEKRKKLRSSLSGGLGMDKRKVDLLLKRAQISPDSRAQELSLQQWHDIYSAMG